ncbi:MAG: hypothetical protein ABI883_09420 [Chthoniobacterales bacterium]
MLSGYPPHVVLLAAAALLASAAPAQAAENDITSSSAIVRGKNLARQNPMQYAVIIEEMRAIF